MEESQEKREWIYRNRKLVAGLVIIFILLQVTITVLTISLNDDEISDINVPRSTIPDSCVYPATYDIEYNTSYWIRGNYVPLINISEAAAVDAAMTFLTVYLPEELLTGLRVDTNNEFWPGRPELTTDCFPRWGMTLISDYMRANVWVNALSGKVVQFSLGSYNTSVFVFESVETVEETESIVIDFLQSQNYTLLPDAVYDGTDLSSLSEYAYHTLTFHQVVDEILIGIGKITFHIDATYGLIKYFRYRWIDLDEIPVDRILPVGEIHNIVLEADNDTFLITIRNTELRLNIIGFDPDSSDFVMRLVYEVTLTPIWGVGGDLYTVDAISGEIVSIDVLF